MAETVSKSDALGLRELEWWRDSEDLESSKTKKKKKKKPTMICRFLMEHFLLLHFQVELNRKFRLHHLYIQERARTSTYIDTALCF